MFQVPLLDIPSDTTGPECLVDAFQTVQMCLVIRPFFPCTQCSGCIGTAGSFNLTSCGWRCFCPKTHCLHLGTHTHPPDIMWRAAAVSAVWSYNEDVNTWVASAKSWPPCSSLVLIFCLPANQMKLTVLIRITQRYQRLCHKNKDLLCCPCDSNAPLVLTAAYLFSDMKHWG